MSYLKNTRTIEDFILLANSESTQYNRKSIIKTFEVYCKVTFNKNIQTV